MNVEHTRPEEAAFPDLYADLRNIAGLFYSPGHVKRKGKASRAALQIITQNLQGFTEKRRERWFRGWKQRSDVAPADIIFVQDTHLKTTADIDRMSSLWNHVWGVKDPPNPLSYWTTTATKSGGVGILLHPRIAARIQPWRQACWTDRRVALQFDDWRLVNIYAPTDRFKRRDFFDDLHDWLSVDQPTLLGGDFNVVLNPQQDRLVDGKPSLRSCESKELRQMVDDLDLLDTTTLTTHIDEESIPDPLKHYTFWRKRSASRIDRFYISSDIAATAQWVEALDPAYFLIIKNFDFG